MSDTPETSAACHCGRPVYIHEALDGFTRGLCRECDTVRCDAEPGACRSSTSVATDHACEFVATATPGVMLCPGCDRTIRLVHEGTGYDQ